MCQEIIQDVLGKQKLWSPVFLKFKQNLKALQFSSFKKNVLTYKV